MKMKGSWAAEHEMVRQNESGQKMKMKTMAEVMLG
jgi:hypothetical protein